MAFVEVEHELDTLLEEFGPPRKTSPGYPFHHLVSDGLWLVRTPGATGSPGSARGLLRAGAIGELGPEFARDLERSPGTFASVVRAILDANFPPTLHQDILDSVGLTLTPAELGGPVGAVVAGKRRDPHFRELVLLAYEYRCAVCGYDGQLGREAVGIDAAHVRWWAANGPDDVSNGVALCSLHHKLFDRGALGLTAGHHVAVSTHFVGRSPAAEDLVLSLVGRPLLPPQPGQSLPAAHHVAWHVAQVFRAPARQATQSQPA